MAEQDALHALADELVRFDCLTDPVPDDIDVPDDYERGINDAGHRLRAALPQRSSDV